jgi:hypothetical protein
LALAGLQIGGNGGWSDSNTVEYSQTITVSVPPGQMVCVPPLFLFFHSDCKLITYSLWYIGCIGCVGAIQSNERDHAD